jgi:hypothetical protein
VVAIVECEAFTLGVEGLNFNKKRKAEIFLEQKKKTGDSRQRKNRQRSIINRDDAKSYEEEQGHSHVRR